MDDSLRASAARAAAPWGRLSALPELVHRRENAVFRIGFEDGRVCALRLHRPGYQSASSVEAELRLMECLADAGFACPWPQRTANGALVSGLEQQAVSVVQWVDGAPIGSADHPLSGEVGALQTLYHRVGGLIADLHLTADAVVPAGFNRQVWDADAICGEAPLWGGFWTNPTLTAPELDLLTVACAAARVRLDDLPPEQCGVIHADLLQENILQSGTTLYLIDFDDCGTGPRLYDLATALIQHTESPVYDELRDALTAGYRGAGGPLPDSALDGLEMFVMLRAVASAGWIAGRATPVDPRQRAYAARALTCARKFLDGEAPGGRVS